MFSFIRIFAFVISKAQSASQKQVHTSPNALTPPPLPQSGRGWTECGSGPGDRLKIKIIDVEPDHEYQFRVIAHNKAGPSEPSDPSDNVICKPRFRELRLM